MSGPTANGRLAPVSVVQVPVVGTDCVADTGRMKPRRGIGVSTGVSGSQRRTFTWRRTRVSRRR